MDETARHALPLIAPGQAQKEITHNEALATLDLLVQAAVTARSDAPPADPAPGACWIVGNAPSGEWAGHAGALAGWTAAGWRFAAPREGLRVWDEGEAMAWTWRGGAWRRGEIRGAGVMVNGQIVVGARTAAISDPDGGGTVDTQARAALSAILAAMRAHGLIATG